MTQFQENAQTDRRMEIRREGRTDPFLQDHSDNRWGFKYMFFMITIY